VCLDKNYRQRNLKLRSAINELSRGQTEQGFDKLDEFGAIREFKDPRCCLVSPASTNRHPLCWASSSNHPISLADKKLASSIHWSAEYERRAAEYERECER